MDISLEKIVVNDRLRALDMSKAALNDIRR